jgi:hypothetical protein
MATTPTLTISNFASPGIQTITWVVTDAPSATLKSIVTIVNDNTVDKAITETAYPAVVNGEAVTSIVLDDTILPVDRKTFIKLVFIYSDLTTVVSANTLVLSTTKSPAKPVLTLTGASPSVRAEDASVSINLSQYLSSTLTKKSINDGYSELTKVIVFLSKVGGVNPSDLQLIEKDVLDYGEWMSISTSLQNNSTYEIAFKVRNAVGDSPLSNTVNFTPKDTPSQIASVKAFSSLTNQKRKNATTFSDDNGDIILYWTQPDDYDFLKSTANGKTATPVTKYVVIEKEYEDQIVNGNLTPVETGYRTIDLPDDTDIKLEPREDVNGSLYNYMYVVTGSAQRLGKKFKYQIIPVNANGDGPVSALTDFAYTFKAPAAQPFRLLHTSTISNVTDTPIEIYDGTMSMRITPGTLATLNGGIGYESNNTKFTYPAGTAVPKDVQLLLTVTNFDTNPFDENYPSTIFSGLVTFVQTVTSTTTGSGANAVTTYTPTGEYFCEFKNIDTDSNSAGTQSLDSLLALGSKYTFHLFRQNKDPTNALNTFVSPPTTIHRTKFMSPRAVSNVQNFPINDDLTPVTSSGKPAIRLLFQQLSTDDLRGLNAFPGTTIKYYAYQQSFIVSGLAPIQHNYEEPSSSNQFIVEQSATGSSVSQYIRTEVYNPELGLNISGEESTPAVSETAIVFPSAVLDSSVTITKVSSTAITVAFTRQLASALGGSPSANCQNRIVIMEDGATSPAVAPIVIAHNSATTYLSPSITLTTGKSYALFIVAERVYTKSSHIKTDPVNRFDGVIIRNNFFTDNFVMNGNPTVPRNIELFPTDKKLEILYDEPASLNGVAAASLKYHFFMNKDSTDFPLFTTSPQVFQASVADVSGSSIATLVKAFALKSDSNNRANVLDLENDVEYKFCMRVVGAVGGNSLTSRNYSQTISTGSINGTPVQNVITLTSKATVAETIVNGDMSVVSSVVVADSVPAVTGLDIAPAENKLNITLNKDLSGTVSDLLIILDNNDGLDVNNNPIAAFDTRSLRTVQAPNGLFNLETYSTAGASSMTANAPDFIKYGFQRVNAGSGNFKYTLAIPELVNGTTYSVSVRFIKNINGTDVFGPSSVFTRAPEAPPTPVREVKFTVAANTINLSWSAPANSGGAGIGGNTELKYRVKLLSTADAELAVFADIDSLSYQISSTTLLLNNSSYKVTVEGYYIKAVDNSEIRSTPVQANPSANNLIRINPPPVGAVVAVTVGSSNTINGTLTLPVNFETTNYPVLRYDVYVRHKATPANRVLVQSFAPASTIGTNPVSNLNGTAHPHGLAYTVTALNANSVLTLAAISSFPSSGIAPNTIGHSRPLNGFSYEVVVEAIPNYTYAQAAPIKTADANPYGNPVITSAVVKSGTSGKTYEVITNLNGSGAISNIVALAKSAASASILVSNLSASTPATPLPAIVISGSIDTNVAANQIATFELAFAAASGSVNDLLVVAVTQNGSDTIVIPATGAFFA